MALIKPENETVATVLRKYAGHKGWCTKYLQKASECTKIIATNWARSTEEKLEENLKNAENQVGAMGQWTDVLVQAQYDKVADHQAEVEDLEKQLAVLYTTFVKTQNERANQQQAPAAPPRSAVKPVSDLKPTQLAADATTADLKQWKRQFLAYFSASNMAAAKTSDQQAYLEACLDRDLAKAMTRLTTGTTPVTGEAGNSCLAILEEIFDRRYPLLLRRRQYFNMTQQQGQDERSFLESVQAAADVADIANMDFEAAICIVIMGGVKDTKLKERLSEVAQPTVAEFTRLIDAHMHAKAASTPSHANATRGRQSGRGRGGSQAGQRRPQVSEKERARRSSLLGKCFRCASAEHSIADCKKSKQVECNKCKEKGHTPAACYPNSSQPSARAVDQQERAQQLSIDYNPEHSAWAAEANAIAAHRPTPTMLL
jgi:uncharacterized coiled-coil protein SlyX